MAGVETDAPVGQDGAENTRGKRRFWEVADDLPEAAMLIDLTSIAADVQADEYEYSGHHGYELTARGGDLDLVATQVGAEAGKVAEGKYSNV